MKYYLGIDVGTFESKGVLVDGAGEIVASAARPHKMIVPQPGYAEHRPIEDWWSDFTAICQELLAKSRIAPRDIRAVGTSAIGPCMLPLDAAGEPLMNAVLYGVDGRARAEIEEMTAGIGNDAIFDRCGNVLTTQSVGPKILWLKRHRPDIFARTAKIVTSTTFLVQRLTGACVIDHYTAANWSPLYRVDERRWCEDLMPGLVPLDRLADLAWSDEIAGYVTDRAAAETGLAAGTPVIVGTVDAASEALSVGVLDSGDMMLMYGSSVFMIQITAERVRDERLWYAPWLFSHLHAAMASLATAGTITHWFRDQMARDLDPAQAMPTLAAEAAASPKGARGLVFLPYLAGGQTPIHDPAARGVMFGLDLTHTRSDLFRAVLEGIACATAHILETYGEAGQAPRRLLAVGGGIRNAVWLQAMSDVSGHAQTVRAKTFGASYGDALLAAHAVGDVPLDAIRKWNPVAREVVPDPSAEAGYKRQFGLYRALYDQTRDLMHRSAAGPR